MDESRGGRLLNFFLYYSTKPHTRAFPCQLLAHKVSHRGVQALVLLIPICSFLIVAKGYLAIPDVRRKVLNTQRLSHKLSDIAMDSLDTQRDHPGGGGDK